MRLIPEEKYQSLLRDANEHSAAEPKENLTEPTPVSEQNHPQETGEEKLSVEAILADIPNRWKYKAAKLLKNIADNANSVLNWDHLGQLLYQGKLVPNSHIAQLIRNTLVPYKEFVPIGSKLFHEGLLQMNISERSNSKKVEPQAETVSPKRVERLAPPPGIRDKNNKKKTKNKKISRISQTGGKIIKPKTIHWLKFF